jgi:hypothetical protein
VTLRRGACGQLEFDGAPSPFDLARFRAGGDEPLTVGELTVRGDVVTRLSGSKVQLVNVLPPETYLAAVLGSEMSPPSRSRRPTPSGSGPHPRAVEEAGVLRRAGEHGLQRHPPGLRRARPRGSAHTRRHAELDGIERGEELLGGRYRVEPYCIATMWRDAS